MQNNSTPGNSQFISLNFWNSKLLDRCKNLLTSFFILVLSFCFQSVRSQPHVSSFSPSSGLTGSTITITGSNFAPAVGGNVVHVGGARATVLSASATELKVRVPRTSTDLPISVTVNNLTGYSAAPYTVMFKGGNVITTGMFATPVKFSANFDQRIEGILSADFDEDGLLDVLVTGNRNSNWYNYWSVYPNKSTPGKLSFGPQVIFNRDFSYGPGALQLADFDGDGKIDVFYGDDDLTIFKNTSTPGNVSFAPPAHFIYDENSSWGGFGVMADDLDGDGKTDIYIYHQYDPGYTYMRNISTNGIIAFAEPIVIEGIHREITLADMSGDGKKDIIIDSVDGTTTYLTILKNTSASGMLSYAQPYKVVSRMNGSFVGLTDITKDGRLDMAFQRNDSLIFFLNSSQQNNLNFSLVQSAPFKYGLNSARFIDFDGDGKRELSEVAVWESLSIFKNTNTVSKPTFAAPVGFSTLWNPTICDFDGDGKQDVAFPVATTQSCFAIALNQSDTSSGPPTIASFSPETGTVDDTITIQGDNFKGTSNLTLGGTAVKSFTIVSNNIITAVVSNGSTGDVTVTNRKGTASKSTFTYSTAPFVKLVSNAPSVLCENNFIEAAVTPVNLQGALVYNWYRNNILQGSKSTTLSIRNVKDKDSVWCIIKDGNNINHKSNVIVFSAGRTAKPNMYISSSAGSAVCKGTTVTFKAIITNGDFSPLYQQWTKNGVIVGTPGNTYTTSDLQDGDSISCTILSAPACTVVPVTASYKMKVDEKIPAAPSVIHAPLEVFAGQTGIVFTVDPVEGASYYKWTLPAGATLTSGYSTNSITVTWGATTNVFGVRAANTCGSSNILSVQVGVKNNTNAPIAHTDNKDAITNDALTLSVYPNPANSNLTVSLTTVKTGDYFVELRDANGKLMTSKQMMINKGGSNVNINVAPYATGIYYISLNDKSGKVVTKRVMISK